MLGGLALGTTVAVVNEPEFLGPSRSWFDLSPWRDLLLFTALLAGMAARSMTEAIERRRLVIEAARVSGKKVHNPRLKLDPWEFSYPLFVSVVVFEGVRQATGNASTLTALLLSFQNGFFWQTILRRQTL